MRKGFSLFILLFLCIQANATWSYVTTSYTDNFNACFARTHLYLAGDHGAYKRDGFGAVQRLTIPNSDSLIYNRSQFYDITYQNGFMYFCGQDTVNNQAVLLRFDYWSFYTPEFVYIGAPNTALNSVIPFNGNVVAVGDNGLMIEGDGNQSNPFNPVIIPSGTTQDFIQITNGPNFPNSSFKVLSNDSVRTYEFITSSFSNTSATVNPSGDLKTIAYWQTPNRFYGAGSNLILYPLSYPSIDEIVSNNFKGGPLNATSCDINSTGLFVTTDHGIFVKGGNSPLIDVLEYQPSSNGHKFNDLCRTYLAHYAVGDNGLIMESLTSSTIPAIPYPLISVPDQCVSNGVTLNWQVGSANSAQWFLNNTSLGYTSSSLFVPLTTPGTHTLKCIVYNSFYTDSITKTFTLLAPPPINTPVSLLDSTPICKQGIIELALDSTISGGQYTLFDALGQNAYGSVSAQGSTTTLTSTLIPAGTYFLTSSDTTGNCVANFTDSITVEVEQTKAVAVASLINAFPGEPIDFYSYSQDTDSALWSFSNNASSSSSTLFNPSGISMQNLGASSNTLIATSIHGCKDTAFLNAPFITTETSSINDCWVETHTGVDPSWSGNGYEHVSESILTKNKSMLAVGSFKVNEFGSEFGTSEFAPAGKEGSYLVSYTPNGTLKWKNYITRPLTMNYSYDYIHINSIIEVDSGDIVIGGFIDGGNLTGPNNFDYYFHDVTGDSILFTPHSFAYNSLSMTSFGFVIKVDSLGRYKSHTGIINGDIRGLTLDKNSKEIVAQGVCTKQIYHVKDTTVTTGCPHIPNFNNNHDNSFIMKIDSDYNYLWSTPFKNVYTNGLYGIKEIEIDNYGNLYVGGEFEFEIHFHSVNGDTTVMTWNDIAAFGNYGSKSYIAKFSPNGNYVWHTAVKGSGNQDMNNFGIELDSIGNVYQLGQTHWQTPTSPMVYYPGYNLYTTIGNYNNYIVKLDSAGMPQWIAGSEKTFNYNSFAETFDIANNKIYTAGWSISDTTHPVTIYSAGHLDSIDIPTFHYRTAVLTRYDLDGRLENVNYETRPELWENPKSLSVDELEHHYIGGEIRHTGFSGPQPIYVTYGDTILVNDMDGVVSKVNPIQCGTNITNTEWNTFQTFTLCSGSSYTFPDATTLNNITSSVTHISNFTSVLSTDSNIHTTISIINGYSGQFNDTICSGTSYTFPDLTTMSNITTNQTQVSTFNLANGCDSILTTNLFVANTSSNSISPTACRTYTSPSNLYTWTNSGVYSDTILNSNGCDSVLLITLTINQANTAVIQSGITLTATASPATYQWIDCSTNTIISGETNQSFTPSSNGNYAVVVTQSSCSDTSACFPITAVSTKDYVNSIIKIYPNPNRGTFEIELDKNYQNVDLRILDLKGRVILTEKDNSFKNRTIEFEGAAGVYHLELKIDELIHNLKLIKE